MYIYIEYITNSIRSISFLINKNFYGIFDDMKQPVGGMEYLSTVWLFVP